jgi:hypothetical protein
MAISNEQSVGKFNQEYAALLFMVTDRILQKRSSGQNCIINERLLHKNHSQHTRCGDMAPVKTLNHHGATLILLRINTLN